MLISTAKDLAMDMCYEDTYSLKDFNTGDFSYGDWNSVNPQDVIIACAHKHKRVRGLLAESIKINVDSEWKPMFGGGITALAGSTIDTVNNLDQLFLGKSIQQPWMNRKFWVSTKPFSLNLTLSFVAEYDAYEEVFEPVQALVSFTFPRESGENAYSGVNNFMKKNMKLTVEKESVNGALLNSVNNYYIPGPAVDYNGKDTETSGDPVTLSIGQAFAFGGVYLEKVNVDYSQSFDKKGYPLAAKVNLIATCMDVNSCDSDGNFCFTEFKDKQGNISNVVNAVRNTLSQAAKDTISTVGSYIDFWK